MHGLGTFRASPSFVNVDFVIKLWSSELYFLYMEQDDVINKHDQYKF